MRLTGKTAGYLVAGIGWATLVFGLALEQAGLRGGGPVAAIGGWTIASGLALAVIAATERGFGALDRFFGEILARTRRPAPRVEPNFDAVAEAPPALAARHGEAAPRRLTRQEAAPRAPEQAPPRAADRPPAPQRAFSAYFDDEDEDEAPPAPRRAAAPPSAVQERAPREPLRPESIRQDDIRQEPLRQEPLRQEPLRQEPIRKDAVRRDPIRQDRRPQSAAAAYPLDAPQPARSPRAGDAAPPRGLPRALPPRALPPRDDAPSAAPFDAVLDRAAQDKRDALAAPGAVAPAAKPAYHPAPAAPANLDAPRRAPPPQGPEPQPRASVIEEGEIAGHAYRVLADLTVEIDTVLGARAFESMEAARRFVGAPALRARSVA